MCKEYQTVCDKGNNETGGTHLPSIKVSQGKKTKGFTRSDEPKKLKQG